MEELKEILNSSLRAIGIMALLLLAACSDIGDRDNPLDPGAENYVAIDDDPESSSSAIQSDDSRDKSSSSVSSSSNASSSSEKQSSSSSSSDVILSASEESSSSKIAPSSSSKDVEPDEKSSSSEQVESSSDEAPVTSSETPTQSSSSVEPSSSSSKDEPVSSSSSETVTPWTCGDSTITRGDREYATVLINEQCWLKENLQYESSSGTTLCYGGVASNCETYGRLYDFEAANLACPTGWRLPTKTEYEDLADYSGADMYDAGAHFKAKSGWTGENGDDLLEFTALPGGKCDEEQTCSKIGTSGYWWTSTEKTKNASHYALYLNGDGSSFTAANIMDNDQYISVRCVKK
ncbi:FISUMP domain-containing protein [uncultured Fibrobacter sp.]|uniref:FISUMP domain-containing protein n=1 Tax=uncultured Fibrobacter sp. TaxID=261512 RepID=UPI0025FDE5B7|nr:FISUMP domain-containing protein [uncultured Fibrobacter sp.]MBR2308327.1 hypothetical protein [Fibrobacter sp.]